MSRHWVRYGKLRIGVLWYIEEYTQQNGHPPVNAEIAREFKRSPAWAAQLLDRLERDGAITRSRESGVTKKRTIRLTSGARTLLENR